MSLKLTSTAFATAAKSGGPLRCRDGVGAPAIPPWRLESIADTLCAGRLASASPWRNAHARNLIRVSLGSYLFSAQQPSPATPFPPLARFPAGTPRAG